MVAETFFANKGGQEVRNFCEKKIDMLTVDPRGSAACGLPEVSGKCQTERRGL